VLVLPLQVYRATADINWPIAAVGFLLVILAFRRGRGVQPAAQMERGMTRGSACVMSRCGPTPS
jgi:hypothetical protein